MLRTAAVPKRSFAGCLTCKSRKKKCDEQKPHCERCIRGDFYCLGYDLTEHDYIKQYSSKTGVKHLDWPSHISLTRNKGPSSDLASLNGLYVLPEHASEAEQPIQTCSSIQRPTRPSTFTKRVAMDPVLIEDTASFTISQFARFARELLFKPTSFPLEKEFLVRMEYSEFTRWSMYLSARVLKDISDGMNGRKYTNWIFQLHQQILESPTPTEAVIAMEGQLAGLHDLAYLGFIASGVTLGYSLFRRCIPIFLRLAALDSNLWSDSATILISQAIQCTYEISKVVVHDTLIAFILGIPPLLHYDITFPRSAEPNNELELLYGISPEVLYFLAKINAYRASRLMGEMAQTLSNWHDVERVLKNGSSTIEHTSEPAKDIERFAVQETWRQATLIYFYMGVGDVNSADPRVEAAVQQVVQLGSTIKSGTTLELHTLIPCVIAGAAARKEKHRARLRSKIVSRSFPYEIAMVIRTSEFAAVLDHLWHSAGAEGKPTTWEDYVQSCRAVLRVV